MGRHFAAPLVLLLAGAATAREADPPPPPPPPPPGALPTVQDFSREGEGTPYVLSQKGAVPPAKVTGESLLLLDGMKCRGPLHNAVAFPRTAPGTHRRVRARFGFAMGRGLGAAFALLDTAVHGVEGEAPAVASWDEPNDAGLFAVALDSFNPPTSHWFDGNGNVHDRPEREVSLHFDGRELFNALSPVEFRDGEEHRLDLDLLFVNGGARATVRIDDEPVVDDRFLPGVRPFESRVAFGGSTGLTSTVFQVDDVEVRWEEPAPAGEIVREPIRVRVHEKAVIHGKRNEARAVVHCPGPEVEVERVLLHFTQGPAPGGWDTWDRCAGVRVWRGEGEERESFEIARIITSFHTEWTWTADVTDYRPLLTGRADVGAWVGTYIGVAEDPEKQKGFALSVDLEFFPGKPERPVLAVENLWQVNYRFGNDPASIAKGFPELVRTAPAGAGGAKLRFSVTGHGGFGEFTAADRVAAFGGREFTNRLWKEDVYLNQCRPQGGTWKFHRAGWAPGSWVEPWEVEVSDLVVPGEPVRIGYRPVPFEKFPEKAQANHWVESQVVWYGE